MRSYFRLFFPLVAVAATSLGAQAKPANAGDFAKAIDPVITQMMTEWHVPGLALGVVKDGQVLYLKGYGYRDVEKHLPVTPQTLMAIGSNSKSFTVTLMGMLVDQKKLSWDTPVKTYLPDFQLYDDYATKNMTPRDLVSHRSGLPRHDELWYGRKFTRQELYERLRYLEPSVSFRSKWQYQNLMFMTAGYLVEKLWNRSWDDLIKEQIFSPLGMSHSLPGYPGFVESEDHAWPYQYRNGATVKVPVRVIDHVGPAGSIYSSVEDMAKYIEFRMSHGANAGTPHVSKAFEDQAQSPQMVVTGGGGWPGFDLLTYGLGLVVASYRGHLAVVHGGGIDGFISQMSWLPDDKVGVMVLTDLGGPNPVPTMVAEAVYDRLLGLTPLDLIGKQRALDAEGKRVTDSVQKAFVAAKVPNTKPSHDLAAYTGTYEHPGYGRLVIRNSSSGGLEVQLDDLVAPLTHYHYDTFEIGDPGGAVPLSGLATFGTNTKGVVDRVIIPLEPNVASIVFMRK